MVASWASLLWTETSMTAVVCITGMNLQQISENPVSISKKKLPFTPEYNIFLRTLIQFACKVFL